ncbi:tyrosine-type recombinase/integrase [Dyadobacter bucti]|uniref:tyrosine-type recombinase/integrase n=1 Tax=Dyadobacter bucti TaxID=2572203 RepID=UPI001107FC47|nr:integrase arm-type DNA-binding domain-containing protein [Dyadobacter bucti]
MPLCDAQCRASKSTEKSYKLFDQQGLYLEVATSGSKIWRLKYRFNGKETRLSLGAYPSVSLLDARKHRDKIREQIKTGIDPVVSRVREKLTKTLDNASTFDLIAKEWHSKNAPAWNPRYAQTVQYRLDKYALPVIGRFPITQLKPPIILACIRKIEVTAPEMARRVKNLISHIFKYAIATGRVETDYTYGLEFALTKYKKKNFDVVPFWFTLLRVSKYLTSQFSPSLPIVFCLEGSRIQIV